MARRTYAMGQRRRRHGDVRRFRDLDIEHMQGEVEGTNDRLPYYIAAGVLLFVLTFWLSVQLASLVHGFDWIPIGAGLAGVFSGLAHLYQNVGDPAQGWPQDIRHLVAPAWILYPVLFAVFAVEVKYLLRLKEWWYDRNREERGGTDWADERVLAEISNPKKNDKLDGGVVLGLSQKGKPLYLERQSHALVVAGTRSGKTAGLCTPALLTFPGVIIATSVKNDLVKDTVERRRQMGEVFIFDPVGAMGLPEDQVAGWTPLDRSREWRDAQRTADALIEVAMSKKGSGSQGNMEFFKRMSQQTLPVLLYAAAVMDEDMRRVVRWLYRINDQQTHAEIDAILRWKNHVKALDAWVGFVTKEPKLRGDIAATMASALVSYEDEKVQSNAMRCDVTPERLFDGRANTLYVVAPMAEQSRLEPIFVALMQSLFLWVSEQSTPLKTPLLGVLDEAANIAALPLLPEILSTIGSQNVSILTSWQDFSQIKARYGEQKNTILNNSRAKMVLPGVADPETIQYFSQVTGETIEEQLSVSGSRHGSQLSIGESRRSLLTPASIREQKVGEAILVYGHLPPAKIKLRMWFKDPLLRRLSEGKGTLGSADKAKGPLSVVTGRLPELPLVKGLKPLASSRLPGLTRKTVVSLAEAELQAPQATKADQAAQASADLADGDDETPAPPQMRPAPAMAPPPRAS